MPTARFAKPNEGSADGFKVQWTLNGQLAGLSIIPSTATPGTDGRYEVPFAPASGGPSPGPGDIVGCTGQATDSVDSLVGPVDTPAPPTVQQLPTGPVAPGHLVNFTLDPT
jgi:hypothetical protein